MTIKSAARKVAAEATATVVKKGTAVGNKAKAAATSAAKRLSDKVSGREAKRAKLKKGAVVFLGAAAAVGAGVAIAKAAKMKKKGR